MIPFIDLKTQQARIKDDVQARLDAVLEHGQYVMGPEVSELEAALAEYAGIDHCVCCASGTDALFMALLAEGVGPGDAVFTTPFTFVATAEVIALTGATPVFVDVDPETFNIDPARLEAAVRALEAGDPSLHPLPAGHEGLSPRGVIPVDIFGLPADYDAIAPVAEARGMFVLGDAAQSFGATYKGRRACALAPVSATSFFPAKPLGCYGDGGAVFCDTQDRADLLRSVRIHGMGEDRYENVRLGITGRLDTMQAAVLLAKLAIFQDEFEARQRVAAAYSAGIEERGLEIAVPEVPEHSRSAWAQYTLRARDAEHRARVQSGLREAGVPSVIYYPKPLHLQTVFGGLGQGRGSFPVAEALGGRVFSLPMHPYLEEADIERIVAAIPG